MTSPLSGEEMMNAKMDGEGVGLAKNAMSRHTQRNTLAALTTQGRWMWPAKPSRDSGGVDLDARWVSTAIAIALWPMAMTLGMVLVSSPILALYYAGSLGPSPVAPMTFISIGAIVDGLDCVSRYGRFFSQRPGTRSIAQLIRATRSS